MTPNMKEAKHIQAMIDRLGVPDIMLLFDRQIGLWSVCQVVRKEKNLLTFDSPNIYEIQPNLMFWIKNSEGKYRVPSEQDVSDVITIVQRAQITFDKGNDWLIDNIERREQEIHDENRKKQSEKIRSMAKPLKRHMKREGIL